MGDFFFTRGFATTQEEQKSPMIINWTLGYQRELWRDAALEIRYVGNRGSNLWRFYNINETNIIENNFVQEFRNAQRNLAINVANGQTGFANNGLPGQVALPIFETAFGPRGVAGCTPRHLRLHKRRVHHEPAERRGGPSCQHARGQRRQRVSNVHMPAYRQRYRRAVHRAGYNAAGPYPINFFQANPFAAGPEPPGC